LKRHEPNAPPGVWRKRRNRRAVFLAQIEQFLAQRADDAVARRVGLDPVLAASLDDRAGGRIDDGGDAAGLCIQQIALAHAIVHLEFDSARPCR
jgi:hypothetical protein